MCPTVWLQVFLLLHCPLLRGSAQYDDNDTGRKSKAWCVLRCPSGSHTHHFPESILAKSPVASQLLKPELTFLTFTLCTVLLHWTHCMTPS